MLFRRAARSEALLGLASSAIRLYLDIAYRTTRWRVVGDMDVLRGLGERPAIMALWHEHIALIPMLWRLVRRAGIAPGGPGTVHVMISNHRDGRLMSRVVARFAIGTVNGSSGRDKGGRRVERGGAAGLRRLASLLDAGQHVAITPDGPRGPAHVAQLGLAQLAALSGTAIVPCAASTRPQIRLRSWDAMRVPVPFGRGVIAVGAAIPVARRDAAIALPAIAAALDAVSAMADHG